MPSRVAGSSDPVVSPSTSLPSSGSSPSASSGASLPPSSAGTTPSAAFAAHGPLRCASSSPGVVPPRCSLGFTSGSSVSRRSSFIRLASAGRAARTARRLAEMPSNPTLRNDADVRGVPGERLWGGGQAVLTGALELTFGTGDERVEIEAREPRVVGKGTCERLPQRPLPGDAGLQSLQLDEAAERRIAPQPPVQLQPGRLLGDPSACRLRR